MTLPKKLLFIALFFLSGLVRANNDSVRVHDLLKVVETNRFDSALAYGNNAKALSIAMGSKQELLIADARVSLGTLYFAYGNYDSCIVHWEFGRDIYKRLADTIRWAKTERLVGVYLDMVGEVKESLEHFNLSRDLYKAVNYRKGLGESYISIAIMQQRLQRYEQAIESSRLALEIAAAEKNERVFGPIYNNMGSIYNNLLEYDSASKYFNLALKEQKNQNNISGLSMTYHNLGSLELGRENYKKALEYYRLAVEMKNSHPESDDALGSALSISICYIKLNNLDSAKHILLNVLKISQKQENLMRSVEAYENLAEVEEKLGNLKLALEYQKLFKRYSDSANSILFNQSLKELESRAEVNQTRDRNDELIRTQEENQALLIKNKKGIYILIGLSVLLLVSIIGLIINLRSLRNSRSQLSELNEELLQNTERLEENNISLEKLMRAKNDLVSVLAHDLRSPFGKIQSIVQLFEMSEDEEEKAGYLQMLDNITHDGMALIQDLIDLSRIEQSEMLDEHTKRLSEFSFVPLFNRLKVSFESHLKAKHLHLEMQLMDTTLINREDYCERICDNILSNAIKYSNPRGIIKITMGLKDDFIQVFIEDNGPGFQKKDLAGLFQRFSRLSARPTGIETSTGLGLYIAKKLAESIKGDIVLLSQEGEPAKFSILFPLDLKSKLDTNSGS